MKAYSVKTVLPLRLIDETRQSTWWRLHVYDYKLGEKRYINIRSQTVLCKALLRNYNQKYNIQKGDFFLMNEIKRYYRKGDTATVTYRGIDSSKWLPWREENLEYFI